MMKNLVVLNETKLCLAVLSVAIQDIQISVIMRHAAKLTEVSRLQPQHINAQTDTENWCASTSESDSR